MMDTEILHELSPTCENKWTAGEDVFPDNIGEAMVKIDTYKNIGTVSRDQGPSRKRKKEGDEETELTAYQNPKRAKTQDVKACWLCVGDSSWSISVSIMFKVMV